MSLEQRNTAKLLHQVLVHTGSSDVGKRRSENQDRFSEVLNDNYRIFVVADGMGGAKGGGRAAQLAINTIDTELTKLSEITPDDIYLAIAEANQVIFKHSIANPKYAGMGTTVVLFAYTGESLFIANVGDSRAYRIRRGEVTQLTEDHTLVNELVKAKLIEPEQAEGHPVAHMLTRSLGPSATVDVDCFINSPAPETGDYYLLCSDGLYNLVEDFEIAQIVTDEGIEGACAKLTALANKRGGTDNITVHISQVQEDFRGYFEDVKHAAPEDMIEERSLVPIYFNGQKNKDLSLTYEKILLGLQDYPGDLNNQYRTKYVNRKYLQGFAVLAVLALGLLSYQVFYNKPLNFSGNQQATPGEVSEALPELKVVPAPKVKHSVYDFKRAQYPKLIELNKTYLNAINSQAESNALIDQEIILNQEYTRLLGDNSEIAATADALNKKLSIWFNRKKDLESFGALKITGDLADYSDYIYQKQQRFKDATWQYLQNRTQLETKPQDPELIAQSEVLLEDRKQTLKDLELSVYSYIQEQVETINQTMTNTVRTAEKNEERLNEIQYQLELIDLLRNDAKLAPAALQNKFLKNIEALREADFDQ